MIRYLQQHLDQVVSLFEQHLELSALALLLAFLIAMPIGILISRYQRLYAPVMGLFGAIYTIPSLALLAILVPIVSIGTPPALIALVAYAQFILIRNIVAGLRSVDPAIVEAARGMGMSPLQILWRVEVPLAMPVIVAGIRIAAITTIGIATIAAYVSVDNLGRLLYDGIDEDYNAKVEVGAIGVAILALLVDGVLRAVEWWTNRATNGPAAAGDTARRP